MSNPRFLLNDLASIDAPEIFLDRAIFSYKTTDENGITADSDPLSQFKKPKKTINVKIRLFAYDNYDLVAKRGIWFRDPVLAKFLKFKIFFASSTEEVNYVAKDIYTAGNLKAPNVKTFSFDDFVAENKPTLRGQLFSQKTKFYLYTDINIEKDSISDISNLVVFVSPYLDQNEICKEFKINIENTADITKFFYAEPKVYSLVRQNKIADFQPFQPNEKIEFIDLTSIDYLREQIYLPIKTNSLKKFGSYFSDLFYSIDFFKAFNISTPYGNIKKDASTIIRHGFFFDKLRFVKENSILPQIFFDECSTADSAKDAIKIQDVKLSRVRKEKLTEYGDEEEELVSSGLSVNLESGVLFSHKISNVNEVDFFSGIDYGIDKLTYGKYKYKVKFTVEDPTYNILLTSRTLLSGILKYFQDYKIIADRPTIQYNDLKDINPHIDYDLENNIYNFKRNGYNVEENRYDLSNDPSTIDALSKQIKDRIDQFCDIYSQITLLTVDANTRNSIFFSISPTTGNPEGTQLFLDLINSLINSVDDILETAKPPQELSINNIAVANLSNAIPNYAKFLEIEHVFDDADETIDAEIIKNFAFDYHTTDRSQTSNGLLYLNRNEIFEKSANQIFKSVNKLNIPQNNNDFTSIILKQNSLTNGNLVSSLLDYKVARVLDVVLSYIEREDFEDIFNDTKELLANLNNKNITEEELNNILNRVLSSGFSILKMNNISVATKTKNKVISNILNNKYVPKIQIQTKQDELDNLIRLKIYKNISLGLLNYSKLSTSEQSTDLEEQSKYLYDREIFCTKNFKDITEENGGKDSRLDYAGFFKILNNTYKKSVYIGFPKTSYTVLSDKDASRTFKQSFYLLKSKIFIDSTTSATRVVQRNQAIKLLGYLQDYSDSQNSFNKPDYQNIPILNRYFLFDQNSMQTAIDPALQEIAKKVKIATGGAGTIPVPDSLTGAGVTQPAGIRLPKINTSNINISQDQTGGSIPDQVSNNKDVIRAANTRKQIDTMQIAINTGKRVDSALAQQIGKKTDPLGISSGIRGNSLLNSLKKIIK